MCDGVDHGQQLKLDPNVHGPRLGGCAPTTWLMGQMKTLAGCWMLAQLPPFTTHLPSLRKSRVQLERTALAATDGIESIPIGPEHGGNIKNL